LAPALAFLNHTPHPRCVCFLLRDFPSPPEEYRRLLAPTARRHDLVAALITDRREDALPAPGLIEFTDAETGARHLVDSAAPTVRRAYTLARERWLDTLRAEWRRAGLEHFTLATDTPYEQDIARFLRQRARRLRL
ncbi:MAG: hypothetical protein K9N49_04430, partial [Candidatus Marinimicrobia bacterium]|nr:hypothetical protein [Candidatus Neomarinimicrobiota bacterium]